MKKIHGLLFLVFLCAAFFLAPVFADEEQGSEAQSPKVDFTPLSKDTDFSGLSRHPQNPAASPLHTLENYQPSSPTVPGIQNPLSAVNPERYTLAPGDTIVLDLWTPEYRRLSAVIQASKTINVPPVGDIPVGGVTLNHLSDHLNGILKNYYKDVHVTADLAEVRTVKVQVLGEVKQPGAYELSGISGALDALIKAGGLTDRSSLRRIELRKDDKLVRELDFFKWRSFGEEEQNPYLEPNEVVFVPVVKNRISIEGEVRRPGNYEFLSGETFNDLMKMAGGYTPEAMVGELKISRISPSHSQVNLSAKEDLALTDGDSIYVPPLSLFQRKIKVIGEIQGAVTPALSSLRTGEMHMVWYHLHENEKVRDVVLNLGGLTPRADGGMARIERKDASGKAVLIPVNLQKLFADGDATQNVALKDGDTLIVPAAADSIYVLGEVARPGVFPYTPNNHVREYVALAGGPQFHANLKHAKLIRMTSNTASPEVTNVNLKSLLQGDGEKDVLLEPGDVIYVPRSEVVGVGDLMNLLGNYAIIKTLFLK